MHPLYQAISAGSWIFSGQNTGPQAVLEKLFWFTKGPENVFQLDVQKHYSNLANQRLCGSVIFFTDRAVSPPNYFLKIFADRGEHRDTYKTIHE